MADDAGAGGDNGQDLDYVAHMYASGEDPWRISDGFYERRKREILLSCLPLERFGNAFEPACANGELSALLAGRCDRLLATDIAEPAVRRTAARLAGLDGARARQLAVPAQWPSGERFDLVVLSEFGYYLPLADWRALAERCAAGLAEDWTVVACHWRHPFERRLVGTDTLHEELAGALAGARSGRSVLALTDEDFRLDVWSSVSDSVARRDGRG